MIPPRDLVEAMAAGEITVEQLIELIRCEADELGLTFEEAEARAEAGTLPKGPLGTDITYLLKILRAA